MDENEHDARAVGSSTRPAADDVILLHASAITVADRGVLITGRSGTGKSGLALQMISRGALLVADDQVVLQQEGDVLRASAPSSLVGLIEARGVGIIRVPSLPSCPVSLVVDLDMQPESRMPESRKITLHGAQVELIRGARVPNLDAIVMILAQSGCRML